MLKIHSKAGAIAILIAIAVGALVAYRIRDVEEQVPDKVAAVVPVDAGSSRREDTPAILPPVEQLPARPQAKPPAPDERLKSSKVKSVRVLAHQASVTGLLTDIIAYRMALSDCDRQFFNALEAQSNDAAKANPTRERAVRDILTRCDGFPEPKVSHQLRDAEGFDDIAEDLLASRDRQPRDPARIKQILNRISASSSVLMTEFFFRNYFVESYNEVLGIEADPNVSAAADRILVRHAVDVRACKARQDCAAVAASDLQCRRYNSCIDSLDQFASERIFAPSEKRPSALQETDSSNGSESLKSRFALINSKLDELLGSRQR